MKLFNLGIWLAPPIKNTALGDLPLCFIIFSAISDATLSIDGSIVSRMSADDIL